MENRDFSDLIKAFQEFASGKGVGITTTRFNTVFRNPSSTALTDSAGTLFYDNDRVVISDAKAWKTRDEKARDAFNEWLSSGEADSFQITSIGAAQPQAPPAVTAPPPPPPVPQVSPRAPAAQVDAPNNGLLQAILQRMDAMQAAADEKAAADAREKAEKAAADAREKAERAAADARERAERKAAAERERAERAAADTREKTRMREELQETQRAITARLEQLTLTAQAAPAQEEPTTTGDDTDAPVPADKKRARGDDDGAGDGGGNHASETSLDDPNKRRKVYVQRHRMHNAVRSLPIIGTIVGVLDNFVAGVAESIVGEANEEN